MVGQKERGQIQGSCQRETSLFRTNEDEDDEEHNEEIDEDEKLDEELEKDEELEERDEELEDKDEDEGEENGSRPSQREKDGISGDEWQKRTKSRLCPSEEKEKKLLKK